LTNDLFCRLSRNSPKTIHINEGTNFITHFRFIINLPSFFQGNFGLRIDDNLSNSFLAHDGNVTGIRINVDLNIIPLS